MSLPILYSFRRCPYAMRARYSLLYAGISCLLREVDLRSKPEELLAVSAKATVPVLQLPDGRVIDESLEIVDYAVAQSDPDNWLLNEEQREIMRNWVDSWHGSWKHAIRHYKYHERYPDEDRRQHWECICLLLTELEQQLVAGGGYFFCGSFTIMDLVLLPMVRQFFIIDECHFDLPFEQVKSWLRRWMQTRIYDCMMAKHEVWVTGDKEPLLELR